MRPIEETLGLYFRAWNDPDHAAELLEQSCAPSIHYVDPRYTCRNVAELAARIGRSRTEAPSFRVWITSAIDGYGDTFRYTWTFDVPEMKLVVPGLDVITRASDGRIATLTSFFGALEVRPAEAPLRVQPAWGS